MILINPNRFQTAPSFTNTKSLDFNGSTGYVDLGSNLNNDSNSAMSISLWVKSDSLAVSKGVFSTQQSNLVGYLISINTTGTINFQHRRTLSSRIVMNSTSSISANTWAHITVTYLGNQKTSGVTFFINGAASGDSTTKNTLSGTVNGQNCTIGKRNTSYFNGHIDEVTFWNKELSASEVSDLYNSGTPPDVSALSFFNSTDCALWIRGEDNVNDSSGNALNGTISGGVTYSTDVP